MSPEVILLAIGCYLFCGISEKVYRIKTGDWIGGTIDYDFQKELSEFSFVSGETTYTQIIEKFGKEYTSQFTHRVIRKQKYDEKIYYFNKELRYVYRKVQKIFIPVGIKYCKSDLELTLFFKDDILIFYNVFDRRVTENCIDYFGPFHTITDKSWLSTGDNYSSSTGNCNRKFYRIFTLYHREEWHNAKYCDFYKDPTYWDDPVYDWRDYFPKKGGMPCGGTIFNSC